MSQLLDVSVRSLALRHPRVAEYFESLGLRVSEAQGSLGHWLEQLMDEEILDAGVDRSQIVAQLARLLENEENLVEVIPSELRKLTIIGGRDKTGRIEAVRLEINAGDVACIVGPTGSGKSQLLADIECLAQGDTPTGRQILIDDAAPSEDIRFSLDRKLVAQLSQNMHFVVDLTVRDFLMMHAQCRNVPEPTRRVAEVIDCANELTGERFAPDVSVTQLSGGQSRALMIADTALLCASPVVLIDEIENAGVDRKRALEMLVRGNKIVLISTHDPLLALQGHCRIVIANGAIAQVLHTSSAERANLSHIEAMDARLCSIRDRLRQGQRIEEPIVWTLSNP